MTPEQRSAYNHGHYLAHRETRLAYAKQWYAENRESIRARANSRREADPEGERAKDRARYRANPEPKLARVKAWRIKSEVRLREHGITRADYDAFLDDQGNACAICRQSFTSVPRIDHDHATGAVRGLLCHSCNVALGHFRDSPDLMYRAIRYVEESR